MQVTSDDLCCKIGMLVIEVDVLRKQNAHLQARIAELEAKDELDASNPDQ
jgi:chaperonin cofactor prefoldin